MEQVQEAIRRHKLLRRGQKILVAVSGGVDSMTLLQVMCRLSRANDWRLAAAHLNHRLRGRESDADEELVHRVTRASGVRLVSENADVRALAAERKLSLEMAARALRHDFLARTARRLGISTVVLAHHADDQLELFFLRLLRGSGGEGLGGMKWRNASPADPQIELVRPLLDVRKADLRKVARNYRIQFREDKTNASRRIQRNRIRHELLPLLQRHYQAALPATIRRTMEIVSAEAELAAMLAKDWLKRARGKRFEKLPVAVQRRVLQMQLVEQGITPEFDLIETLRREPMKKVALDPVQIVWRDVKGRIQWARISKPLLTDSLETRIDLRQKKDVIFNGARIVWTVEQNGGARRPMYQDGRELFDADKVGRQIILRHWRAGDRFQPIGMQSPVKLQDLFVNAKIPKERRGRLVIATTRAGEIFWVEQLRIAEQFKLTAGTKRRLRWAWRAA